MSPTDFSWKNVRSANSTRVTDDISLYRAPGKILKHYVPVRAKPNNIVDDADLEGKSSSRFERLPEDGLPPNRDSLFRQ